MKIRLLEQRHPAHDGERLGAWRALYSGGKLWEARAEKWLPRHPEEAEKVYAARLARALYHNHTGPIVNMLAAALFAESPQVDLDGDWVADFLSDVDREGTTAADWTKARLVDALVEREAWAWVNLPARAPTAPTVDNRRDEEDAGLLDAFLVSFTASQVIDWEVDDRGQLAWILVRDVVESRPDLDAPRQRTHRWTQLGRTQIRRWTWSSPNDVATDPPLDAEAEELPAIVHGLGGLPVARLSLTEGLHALGHLHHPAIAHLRARNDLSWALHRAAHPLLWIASKWQDRAPILGPGYYLQLDREDEIGFAESSGANYQLLAEDVVQLREELYRVVHQMAVGADSDATRAKGSGESKAADWRALEIVLSALAEAVRGFMVDTLRLVAKARGQADADPVVTGLDGWQEEDLDVWLGAAAMATDAHAMSATFKREVAKRQAQRVLTGADAKVLETVSKEIDAAEVPDPALYTAPPPRDPHNPEPTEPGSAP